MADIPGLDREDQYLDRAVFRAIGISEVEAEMLRVEGLEREDLYLDRRVFRVLLEGGGGGGGGTPQPPTSRQSPRVFYDEMTTTAAQVNDFMIPFVGYESGLPTIIYRNGIKLNQAQFQILMQEGGFVVRFANDTPPGTFLSIEIYYLEDVSLEGEEDNG